MTNPQLPRRGLWKIQYIGPPQDAHCFVDALREEGLTAEYAPLLSTRPAGEVFEVGVLTVAGPDLHDRAWKAVNGVLQQFPVGRMGIAGYGDEIKDPRQHELGSTRVHRSAAAVGSYCSDESL